jgi:hypothetical protein
MKFRMIQVSDLNSENKKKIKFMNKIQMRKKLFTVFTWTANVQGGRAGWCATYENKEENNAGTGAGNPGADIERRGAQAVGKGLSEVGATVVYIRAHSGEGRAAQAGETIACVESEKGGVELAVYE